MHRERLCFVVGIVVAMGCGKVEPTPGEAHASDAPDRPPDAVPPPASTDAGAPELTYRGGVTMLSGGGAFYANAQFPTDSTPSPQPSTTPCKLSPAQTAAGPSASESAGDIVIDVEGARGELSSTLSYDSSQKSYEAATLDAARGEPRVEKGGSMLHVRAKGATVPAFEATMRAAYDIDILEPADHAILTDRSGDLVVRWTDQGNETVYVGLASHDGATISCNFPAAAKMGVIPAALVRELVAIDVADAPGGGDTIVGCDSGYCLTLDVRSFRSAHTSAGAFDISLLHATGAVRHLATKLEH